MDPCLNLSPLTVFLFPCVYNGLLRTPKILPPVVFQGEARPGTCENIILPESVKTVEFQWLTIRDHCTE